MTGVVEGIVAAAGAIGSAASTIGSAAAFAAPYVSAAGALASAGLAISGSQQQSRMFTAQAVENTRAGNLTLQQSELAARQEELRGREQANQVREALLRTIATQRATYAAAGLEPDEGTPLTVADETRRQAERELEIAGGNTQARAAATRLDGVTRARGLFTEAGQLRQRGDAAITAGYSRAGATIFDYADRAFARSPGTVTRPRRDAGAGAPE